LHVFEAGLGDGLANDGGDVAVGEIALSKQFAPESLEVTLGLWYEGYAEKPSE